MATFYVLHGVYLRLLRAATAGFFGLGSGDLRHRVNGQLSLLVIDLCRVLSALDR
jgi:hypothetical protein